MEPLAAMAPSLQQAIEVARRKAYLNLDGTLLRIDRSPSAPVGTGPSTPASTSASGVNLQVITDPAGRLIWPVSK